MPPTPRQLGAPQLLFHTYGIEAALALPRLDRAGLLHRADPPAGGMSLAGTASSLLAGTAAGVAVAGHLRRSARS